VGRVSSIEAIDGKTVAVLEFFHRTPIPKDSRFINYNYSLFGARMVILVQGNSREPMDGNRNPGRGFQHGRGRDHPQVEDLLVTVLEYKRLGSRLEKGSDTSLSIQQLLTTKVYPALEQFGALTKDLEALQDEAGAQLDQLAAASVRVNGFGRTCLRKATP